MLIYGVIPGIIALLFYGTAKALTQLAPESIWEYIYILLTLVILPVGYGYFLYRRISAEEDKKYEKRKMELEREQNRSDLVKELCNFIHSSGATEIYVDFFSFSDFGYPNISKLLFFTKKYGSKSFVFSEHGYADIGKYKLIEILQELETRFDGYLKIDYSSVGSYHSSLPPSYKIEHGMGVDVISPIDDYDTSISKEPSSARLYLGDEAKKVRQIEKDEETRKNSLKQI